MIRAISALICWISAYTHSRCSGVTYSSWCSSSHMFMYLICSSSLSSNTANVLSWKATAEVIMTAYKMRVRQSIQLFNEQFWVYICLFDGTHLTGVVLGFQLIMQYISRFWVQLHICTMRDRARLTHDVVVQHGFIIRSSDTIVKPGYSRVFFLLLFFLYRGYFIIALPVLPPCSLNAMRPRKIFSENLFYADRLSSVIWPQSLHGFDP